MCGLLGSLLTFGENLITIAPLEIYLMIKMLIYSILILPAVCLEKIGAEGFAVAWTFP